MTLTTQVYSLLEKPNQQSKHSAATVLTRDALLVRFHGTVATCNCHGSEFNTSGGVVRGPASRSLHKYTAVLDGNVITINELAGFTV